jgi:hypothetical protein
MELISFFAPQTAMFTQSRVLPTSILTALEPLQGSDSSVLAMEIEHESWPAGRAGSLKIIDLFVRPFHAA